jgi:hypothetical protein
LDNSRLVTNGQVGLDKSRFCCQWPSQLLLIKTKTACSMVRCPRPLSSHGCLPKVRCPCQGDSCPSPSQGDTCPSPSQGYQNGCLLRILANDRSSVATHQSKDYWFKSRQLDNGHPSQDYLSAGPNQGRLSFYPIQDCLLTCPSQGSL